MVCVAGGDYDFAVSVVEVMQRCWSSIPLASSTGPQMHFLAPLLPIGSGAGFAPIAQRPRAARLRLAPYRRPLDWFGRPPEWGVSLEHRIAAWKGVASKGGVEHACGEGREYTAANHLDRSVAAALAMLISPIAECGQTSNASG